MFARLVTSHIKPGQFDLMTSRFEEKVIPLPRKQQGFRDEVSFFNKDRNEAVAISFWNTEADELKYEKNVYPEILKSLTDTFDSAPDVRHFEVANSTMYKIRAN